MDRIAQDYIDGYAAELRTRAEDRRSEGGTAAAMLYERIAGELVAGYRTYMTEAISDAEAIRAGVKPRQLRRIRQKGTVCRALLPVVPVPLALSGPHGASEGTGPSLADRRLARAL